MTSEVRDGDRFSRMGTEPVRIIIPKLALPSMISMLVTSVYNMADTFFVSRLGASATGGVGIVFPVMIMIQAFGITFATGGGSLSSILLGERKFERASAVISTAFFSVLVIGVGFAAGGLFFLEELMRLLGATDTILPHASAYGSFILLGAPIMAASFVLNNALRGEGNARLALIGLASGGVINVILDPIFIFGFDMGVTGAAVATVLSQFIGFCILLSQYLRGKTALRISLRLAEFRLKMYGAIMRIGFPSFLRQGLSSVAQVLLYNAAAVYGDAAVAAMAITFRINHFMFSLLLGFGHGFQPVAGYNYGAKNYGRVLEAYSFSMIVGFVGLGIVALAMGFFAEAVIGVFVTDDLEVVRIGVRTLRLQCLTLPLIAVTTITSMIYQSMGKAFGATVLALARQGFSMIPVLLVLPRVLGLDGVMGAQSTADLITFAISVPFVWMMIVRLRRSAAREGGMDEVVV